MNTNLMDYAWYKQRGLGKDEEESIDQKFFDKQQIQRAQLLSLPPLA